MIKRQPTLSEQLQYTAYIVEGLLKSQLTGKDTILVGNKSFIGNSSHDKKLQVQIMAEVVKQLSKPQRELSLKPKQVTYLKWNKELQEYIPTDYWVILDTMSTSSRAVNETPSNIKYNFTPRRVTNPKEYTKG